MVRNMAKGAGITVGTIEAAVASVAAVAGKASARCRSDAVPCQIQNPVVATLAGGFVLADLANLVAFLAGCGGARVAAAVSDAGLELSAVTVRFAVTRGWLWNVEMLKLASLESHF